MRGVPIPGALRAEIKAMFARGASYADICRKTGRATGTIYAVINCRTGRTGGGAGPGRTSSAGVIPPRHDLGSRWCLKCGELFRREFSGNFVCRACRGSPEWHSLSPFEP